MEAGAQQDAAAVSSYIWRKPKVIFAMEWRSRAAGSRTQLLTNGLTENWGWIMENGNSPGDPAAGPRPRA